jgi:hypothetical protein
MGSLPVYCYHQQVLIAAAAERTPITSVDCVNADTVSNDSAFDDGTEIYNAAAERTFVVSINAAANSNACACNYGAKFYIAASERASVDSVNASDASDAGVKFFYAADECAAADERINPDAADNEHASHALIFSTPPTNAPPTTESLPLLPPTNARSRR